MMNRLLYTLLSASYLLAGSTATALAPRDTQHALAPTRDDLSTRNDLSTTGVSPAFFSSLERLARLVDITYCVGTTGVTAPFSCVSRCHDFPSLHLVATWSTGVISLADSCGYVAIDHGLSAPTSADTAHEPEILVAFRGTYSIANTVIDLSTVPQEYVPYPSPDDDTNTTATSSRDRCANCTVHTGFLASWTAARDLVLPALLAARASHPTYRVHLVGHSLGGAVAALAGLELRLSRGWAPDAVRVTTFGEPRVGNAALASYLDRTFGHQSDADQESGAYRRVTHAGDPVPLLPPAELGGYASHAGEVFIRKPGLQPGPADLALCRGAADPECIAGGGGARGAARLRPWELFFAHRDYFWRLGLCVPRGDPWDWGRGRYGVGGEDEL